MHRTRDADWDKTLSVVCGTIMTTFAKLTAPDGSSVWVNVSTISLFREPLLREYPMGTNCVLVAGGATLAVREYPAAILAVLNGR